MTKSGKFESQPRWVWLKCPWAQHRAPKWPPGALTIQYAANAPAPSGTTLVCADVLNAHNK